jgi:tetratricopeptide (TPR) repeat protein
MRLSHSSTELSGARRASTILFVLSAALAGCGGDDVANCAALRRSAPDKALEHCNRAIGSRLVWSKEKAQARLDRGALHSDREQWDASIADVTRAIDSGRLSPRHLVIAYFDRGTARLQKGELDAGIEDLDEAIRLDPLYADAYSNLALARRMQGKLEQSLADANSALKITPRHARALLQRGATYLVGRNN